MRCEITRKLATIRRVKGIHPIPNADKIEVAEVDGWEVVVKKGDFVAGDLGVYFEIDSFLPIRSEFEFLRASSFKVDAMGKEGFRLKTIKLRGQVSQGLLLPLATLNLQGLDVAPNVARGYDLTDHLGVTLYEPPIPASLNGEVVGPVPTFIHKTDQERVQNIDLEKYKGLYEVTEKIDGTSATFYFNDGKFGVCGRNWEYKPTADNIYWKIAKQFDLERKMVEKGLNVAIQGEIFGEGINGNPLKIKGQRLLVFDAWDIGKSRYLFYKERGVLIRGLGLEMVPVVFFKNIIDCIEPAWGTLTVVMDVLPLANGSSKINPGARREGLVFKHVSVPNTSFKVVSNEYLLKTDS